jgi:flagellar assembly protein FliH
MNWSPKAVRTTRVLRGVEPDAMSLARIVTPRASVPAVTDAPATLEEQLEQARRLGFEAGRSAALQDATVRAEDARASASKFTAERLMELATQVARDRAALVEEILGEYVDLAFELTRTLVDDDLALRDDAVREAVVRALHLAPPDEDLVVRVHPDAGICADELTELTAGSRISVREDASIEPGGCIVEAGACRIDGQTGAALERVRTELAKLRRTPRAVDAP